MANVEITQSSDPERFALSRSACYPFAASYQMTLIRVAMRRRIGNDLAAPMDVQLAIEVVQMTIHSADAQY